MALIDLKHAHLIDLDAPIPKIISKRDVQPFYYRFEDMGETYYERKLGKSRQIRFRSNSVKA